ncbi:MAG: TAXI family TRAP transporter solute-binding subunit [Bacillota bacterium]
MKKFYLLFFAMLVILAGCNSEQSGTDSNSNSSSEKPTQARIFMVPSGNDFLIASGMAQLATEKGEDIKYTISDDPGNMSSIRKVMQGKGELTNIVGANAVYAYNGTHTFEGEPYENLRAVVSVPAPVVQFIVREDSGIDSLDDFKDNATIATFQGTAHMTVNLIMEKAGKKLDKDYNLQTLPGSEQIDALKDGAIDALVTWSTVPSPGYVGLDQTTSIKILPIDEGVLKEMQAELDPGAELFTVPKGVYSGQKEEALTSKSTRYYITNSEVDEKIIYDFTKFLIENAQELVKYHPSAEEITIENAIKGISVPLHPGAVKYFQEQGIEIPDEIMPPESK